MGSLSAVAAGNAAKVVACAEQALRNSERSEPASWGDGRGRLEIARQLSRGLAGHAPYAWWSFLNRWMSAGQTVVAVDAFDAAADDIEPETARSDPAWGTVDIPTDFEPPTGFKGFPFHLTRGGWDGHPYMGFIHYDLVYPFVFGPALRRRPGGGDPNQQKRQVAAMAPREHYARILDMGTGSGAFLARLGETYPGAELHGIDLSPTLLRYAHHHAGEMGQKWHLKAAASHATGYEDGSFDLVAMFVLLHEVPRETIALTIREAFRLLEPGGDVLMADAVPYRYLDPVRVMVQDWETENRNEPFWRGQALTNLPEVLGSAGFVEIKERAGGPAPFLYPWVTQAQKPQGAGGEGPSGRQS